MMWWFAMAQAAPSHSLAAVYDTSASIEAARGADETRSGALSWRPSAGMEVSCGPAKSPDGLGVFEAEAVGSGMTPVLTVLLEGSAGEALDLNAVRVSLGRGEPEVLLQPMVLPRHLEIVVKGGPGTERVAQLVRTQLETETCMEHKTGRAWTGHAADRIRQAFLLDPPFGSDRSRKFFGGQTDPVPALIGPPDACIRLQGPPLLRGSEGGRGEGSLALVPTDVWGASLRDCNPAEMGGSFVVDASEQLPLRVGGDKGAYASPRPVWTRLEVMLELEGTSGTDEERSRVTVTMDGQPLIARTDLFVPTDSTLGMIDLLAAVPYLLPTAGPEDDPDLYTVLMFPDWQVVEALRRLEHDDPKTPMRSPHAGVADGVSTLLSHPDLLFVQLRPEKGGSESWANLASTMSSVVPQPWGYTVGSLHGRAPIVLPTKTSPTWDQTLRAQRGDVHAALLGGLTILGLALFLGVRRLQDLFNPRPEERAHYWPGRVTTNVHDNMTNSELPDEEGGE